MATIVVTFFLFARFNVYKMDADCKEKRSRGWCFLPTKIVEQQDRLAMDPQRFEEILSEITTGYGNIRSSFENVNIAEILEEMVTEFARAALEAEEAPKFTELAVLLQHCAQLYGRKVDFLYQHVLDVCDALAGAAHAEPAPAAAPDSARRRRRASAAAGAAGFTHITVEAAAGATRASEAPRPPPTLPRMYIELEPRVAGAHDAPLRDLAGEPVGLPHDYHVAWRLRDGFLLDELEAPRAPASRPPLRPLSLLELQQALAAAAPPDPPPRPPSTLPPPSPLPSPPPPESEVPPPASETPPPAVLAQRKRRSTLKLADIIDTPIKMFKLDPRSVRRAAFCPPERWVARVAAARAQRLLHVRRRLSHYHTEFRGFEDMYPEKGGFPGWSREEAAAAAQTAHCASLHHTELESDDDGFFENSSFSSLDSTRFSPPRQPPCQPPQAPPLPGGAACPAAQAAQAAWCAGVAARAAAQEARGGVDVRALGGAVLRALPPAGALPFPRLLRRAAAHPHDVSRLLLATLFLANSGNVEISESGGGSLGAFTVTLLSTDQRHFAAAAAAEAALHAPAPPAPAPAPAAPEPNNRATSGG